MAVVIRPIRPAEIPAVDRLLSQVFTEHSAKVGSMVREFAYDYTPANLRHALSAFVGGRMVAHAVSRRGTLLVRGTRIGWASYGNVATHPDFRGQGIAGAVGQMMFGKLRAAGVDLVYISGTRSLYTRAGAAECGSFRTYTISAGRIPAAGQGLSVRRGGVGDAKAVAEFLSGDPVRFEDDAETVRSVLRTGWVQCQRPSLWLVTFAGRPVGFVLTAPKSGWSSSRVVIYGGLRLAVAATLPEIVRRAGARRLPITVPAWDTELTSLMTATRGKGTPAGLQGPGTLLLLDPPRLCRRLGLPPVHPRGPRALAAVTQRLFGKPGATAAPIPLPLVGLRYM